MQVSPDWKNLPSDYLKNHLSVYLSFPHARQVCKSWSKSILVNGVVFHHLKSFREDALHYSRFIIVDAVNYNDGQKILTQLKTNRTVKKLVWAKQMLDKEIHPLLDAIVENQYLKEVSIQAGGMTERGVCKLLDAVRQNSSLRVLALTRLRVDHETTVTSLSSLIKENTTLARLELVNGDFDRSLDLSPIADALASSKMLKELFIDGNSLYSDRFAVIARGLAQNKSLTNLNSGDNFISDSTSLCDIVESNSKISDLSIRGNFGETDSAQSERLLAALARGGFTSLDLGSSGLASCQAEPLTRAISVSSGTLSSLSLDYNKIATQSRAVSDALSACLNLQRLSFKSCFIGAENIFTVLEKLKGCTKLQYLNLDGNVLDEKLSGKFAAAVSTLSSLESLSVGDNSFGDQGSVVLASHLSNLRILELHNNDVSSSGILSILQVLEGNSKLEYLNLKHNNMDALSLDQIVASLSRNKRLSNLNLAECGYLGPNGVSSLSKAFSNLEVPRGIRINLTQALADEELRTQGDNWRAQNCYLGLKLFGATTHKMDRDARGFNVAGLKPDLEEEVLPTRGRGRGGGHQKKISTRQLEDGTDF
jgi:Ran GTPase-activating protein (RanGAP) involved in mRNA processing and transport